MTTKFKPIADKYKNMEEVQVALRKAGLEGCDLIVGVDYTKSNTWTGKRTFSNRCLHDITGKPNFYQSAIDMVGRCLSAFDDDNVIPAYGFGDSTTKARAVFPFYPDRHCNGIEEVLQRYTEMTPGVILSGPTSFGPIIRKAIEIVKYEDSYHILLIIADGEFESRYKEETVKAIVEASEYPLSIVMIGVGDGPWRTMEEFDDKLPERKFDNFQFVNYEKACKQPNPEIAFTVDALQEIPAQYNLLKEMGKI